MNPELLLSVVICVYNREDLLYFALSSLAEQTLSQNSYEVLIVDNNSTDRSTDIAVEFVHNYSNFRLFHEKKQGLSHARNRGVLVAQGRYIAFMDDDAKAPENWCAKIVESFLKDSRIVAVGGQIHPFFEKNPPAWVTDIEIRSWGNDRGMLKTKNARLGFSGSNMAFHLETLKKYGGFAPEFGMTGNKMRMAEETELFTRIYENEPFFWYDPDILIYHWVSERNMNSFYQFKRSFASGVANAKIDRKRIIPLKQYAKEGAETIHFILINLLKILFHHKSSTDKIRSAMRISYRLGFLIRQWR